MEPTRYYPLLAPPAKCVACQDPQVRPLHVFPVNHNKRRVTRQIHLALIGCERCGLVFSHPAPTPTELDTYYGSAAEGWDERISTDPWLLDAKLARKREANARDYELLRENGRLPLSGPRRALDFGCGIGGWLDVLAADGWETSGIEPGPNAAAVAGIRHRILTQLPSQPEFELVVVQHTLEHLHDPLEPLTRLAAATVEDGHIYVSVPNFARLGEHRDFVYIAGDKHVCSFTPAALSSIFALAGFELVAHSNDPSWKAPVARPHGVSRLVAIGRRSSGAVRPPRAPLTAAIEALADYGRIQPEPEPPGSRNGSRLRRLARRALR
jgi:2-polyprenyl-3-methyl-5-hydroxy-6-metoxy-1,4-benzoquinol methylase